MARLRKLFLLNISYYLDRVYLHNLSEPPWGFFLGFAIAWSSTCIRGSRNTGPLNKFDKLQCNSKRKIVSIDIPSGLNSDTGQILGSSIIASVTICMGFYKPAHFLIPSKNYCGEMVLLKLPLKIPSKIKPKIHLLKKR